jgi:hypothetical protein
LAFKILLSSLTSHPGDSIKLRWACEDVARLSYYAEFPHNGCRIDFLHATTWANFESTFTKNNIRAVEGKAAIVNHAFAGNENFKYEAHGVQLTVASFNKPKISSITVVYARFGKAELAGLNCPAHTDWRFLLLVGLICAH